jgi:hypothetical protein
MSSPSLMLRTSSSAVASTSCRTPSSLAGLSRGARAPICSGSDQQRWRRPRGECVAAAAGSPACPSSSDSHRRRPVLAAAASPDDSSGGSAPQTAAPAPVVAVEGDVVRVHWSCRDAVTGAVLECSRGGGAIVASAPRGTSPSSSSPDENDDEDQKGEPLTFEVGAGDTQNNPIFEAFDDAVRGLPVGGRAEIEAKGGAWDPSRLFTVPRAHDEVARLEGRYKK